MSGAVPVEVFVNDTASGLAPEVGAPVNCATGGAGGTSW